MLQKNKNIIIAINKFKILMCILVFFQIIFILLLNFVTFDNFEMFSTINIDYISLKNFIIAFFIICFIVVDYIYFFNNIYKRNSLISVEPRECIIEDFIITYYTNSNSNDINYSIEDVKNFIFFEGIVEVEKINN